MRSSVAKTKTINFKDKKQDCPSCGQRKGCFWGEDEAGNKLNMCCFYQELETTPCGEWVCGHAAKTGNGWTFYHKDQTEVINAYLGVQGKGDSKKLRPAPRLSPLELNRVYGFLLRCFSLAEHHREGLLKRGFTDEEIQKGGYVSFLSQSEKEEVLERCAERFGVGHLLKCPGFQADGKGVRFTSTHYGLLIPKRNYNGYINALRIRLDEEVNGGKYRPFGRRNEKNLPSEILEPHVSPFTSHQDDRFIRITEGELKADLATLRTGVKTMGLPGMHMCHKEALKIVQAHIRKNPETEVLIAFDKDEKEETAEKVNRELLKLIELLNDSLPSRIIIEDWEKEKGKGIDDFLLSQSPEKIELLEVDEAFEELSESPTLKQKRAFSSYPDTLKRILTRIRNLNLNPETYDATELGDANLLTSCMAEDILLLSKGSFQGVAVWGETHWLLPEEFGGRSDYSFRAFFQRACEALSERLRPLLESEDLSKEAAKIIRARIRSLRSKRGGDFILGLLMQNDFYKGENLRAAFENFDDNPMTLNFLNCTLHLNRDGSFRELPHNKKDLITLVLPFDYDPKAVCPVWERVFGEVHSGDPETISLVGRFMGYSLCGNYEDQNFILATGEGANGKSLLFETYRDVLGPYAKKLSSVAFSKGMGANNEDIYNLKKTRFAVVDELPTTRSWDEALLKQVTSGSRISIGAKYKANIEFECQTKVVAIGNTQPRFDDSSDGLTRRVIPIEYTKQFTSKDRDPLLKDKLREELPGIINWALKMFNEWATIGFPEVKAIKEARRRYKVDNDPVLQWLEEVAEVTGEEENRVNKQDAFEHFRAWAENTARIPNKKLPSNIVFFKRMKAIKGIKDVRLKVSGERERVFEGLKLLMQHYETKEKGIAQNATPKQK